MGKVLSLKSCVLCRMARIESFEQMLSWQKARELTRAIYALSKQGAFAKDFALRDQIRRAAVSVLSNIAEGFERGGDREFTQFLSLAKGSCAELRSQLYVALDQSYLSREEFIRLKDLAVEINKLISGMMSYLSNSQLGGRKFRRTSPATDSRPKTLDSRPVI